MILLTLAQPPSAHAQELPVEAEALLNQEESALEDVGGWNLQGMLGWLAELLTQDLQKPIRFALQAAGYLLLAGLLALLAGGESWRQCMDAVSALGFGVLSLNAMMSLAGTVAAAAQDCQNYLIAFVPVFSGVAAMGGHTAGAMAYSGMFFSMSGFLAAAIRTFLLPALQIYFCFSACACIWGNSGIEDAAALFVRCCRPVSNCAGSYSVWCSACRICWPPQWTTPP